MRPHEFYDKNLTTQHSNEFHNAVLLIMANNTSPHVLPTAANLLGFCLFVITSLHITNKAASSLIDEFASVVALLLTFSCLLSFISIRTNDLSIEKRLETIADYLFMASLAGIVVVILLLVLGFIR